MTDEKSMVYRALVDTSMINERRDVHIAGLLRIMETMLEEHLLDIAMDNPRLVREQNCSWLFLSLCTEVQDAVAPGEVLLGRTWYSGRKGPLFRRELELCHEDGSRAVAASFFSGLIDLGTRKILRDRAFLERYTLPEGEILLQADSRMAADPQGYRETGRQQVRPSWLDALGHVNNARYGDMIYDQLCGKDTLPPGALRRLELYFVGELRCFEEVSLLRKDEESFSSVLGLHGATGESTFCSRVFLDR